MSGGEPGKTGRRDDGSPGEPSMSAPSALNRLCEDLESQLERTRAQEEVGAFVGPLGAEAVVEGLALHMYAGKLQ